MFPNTSPEPELLTRHTREQQRARADAKSLIVTITITRLNSPHD